VTDLVEVDTTTDGFRELAWRLGLEVDGKRLQRDLAGKLRAALEPAKGAALASLASIPSKGLSQAEPLRAAIAGQMVVSARLSGTMAGARVRVKKGPARFRSAPKRLNRRGGWRHRVYGRNVWVHQVGKPDWFDGPMKAGREGYRRAVHAAMQDAAGRITRGA
jgi:hypothetical protein